MQPPAGSRAAGAGARVEAPFGTARRGWNVPTDSQFHSGDERGESGAAVERTIRDKLSRPNTRVIGAAPHATLEHFTAIATRCRVRCTRVLGRPTGDEPIDQKGCAGETATVR
jgi:hypothetical protein